jgi:predicted transcriptional regulator
MSQGWPVENSVPLAAVPFGKKREGWGAPYVCVILHADYTSESIPRMPVVQIVLDKKLLQAADRAAQRTRQNRSALVRDALEAHLRQLEVRAREERDRQGYARLPLDADARDWESAATWPPEWREVRSRAVSRTSAGE